MKKVIGFNFLFVLLSSFSFAQLTSGDIAFIGYNTDGVDDFTFIALTDIPASEVIYFTEEGWNVSTGTWAGTTEGHATYTAPAAGLTCGSVVRIYESASSVLSVDGSGSISLSTGGWSLSGGDQVLAYQAASPEPAGTPTFIAGIHGDDGNGSPTSLDLATGWNNNAASPLGTARSNVPPGLTNGTNCVSLFPSIGTETDNAKYNGTLTGTSTTLRGLINDRTNWISDNSTAYNISPAQFSPSVTCTATAGSWDGSTSTDWNVASNWTGNVVPTSSDNITIPSAPSNQPHVTLDPASPAACNNITIDAGATLTIDAGKALTVSGDTDNDGTILIKADATGIGSFIDNGTITGSGSFQMEQYLTGSGGATPDGVFYYVSSPIPNATAADYNVSSGNKLWVDDEPSQAYPQLTFGAIPLEVGQGYIARMGATGAITFDGSSYNTGNITEGSLSRTGTTELNRGYNLVGNPYPSTVNWDDLSRTNLETTMWYRTNNAGVMTFDTYNATGMVGTNNNGGGTVDGTIPPTQAFWVRVDADGNTGSISFENADRTHGTLSSIYKAEAEEGTVRLSLSNGTVSDEQVIYFDASAMDGLDDYDSRKFWASGIPQLYSNLNEDTLTINGLNSPTTTQMVPLGMKIPSQGNYSLDANSITFTETPAFLEDTYLNVFQDLNVNPNYSFTSDAGNISDRFILHFNNASVGIEETESASHVFASNNQLNIRLSPNMENATVQVLDMAGRVVASHLVNQTSTTMEMNVPTGIYLISVETTKGTDTHKVVLQ